MLVAPWFQIHKKPEFPCCYKQTHWRKSKLIKASCSDIPFVKK